MLPHASVKPSDGSRSHQLRMVPRCRSRLEQAGVFASPSAALNLTAARRPPFAGLPNGPEVNPRGQGPRDYGSAARRLPAS